MATPHKLVTEVLALPDDEREEVLRALLDSFDAPCDLAPDEMAELDAAIAEADAGDDSDLVSHEAVLASLDEIHASR